MALAREDRRHAVAPRLLHGREDPHLVVHEHVALGGVAPLDVLELLLLVDVHEHVAAEGVPEAGAPDLPRLEDDVAVREDDGPSVRARPLDDVERVRVEPLANG